MLLGPVIGGVLQIFSIRLTFFITGAALTDLLHELDLCGRTVRRSFATPTKSGSTIRWRFLPNPKLILVLLSSTLIVQFGNISISPIISLYVKGLMHNVGHHRGRRYYAALPGISNIIAAPRLGRYGDQHGSVKSYICHIFATVMYVPKALSLAWMLDLRFMIGIPMVPSSPKFRRY